MDRPNIVMVSWDSVRADHMPFHGYERNTCPFVSEMAADGLVFENTQVSAVGTPASFSGIFTGQHADGAMMSPDPGYWSRSLQDKTLLSEVLQNNGYHTGGFHFNALMSREYGWNEGWDTYNDGKWTDNQDTDDTESGYVDSVKRKVIDGLQGVGAANLVMHTKKMVEKDMPIRWERLQDSISTFIEQAPEPFFLWVLLIDTHHPWYAPKEYHEWDQPGIRKTYVYNYIMRRHRKLVGERHPGIVNAYDNTMRYADEFTRWLTAELAANGYDDTPFIFHSDHGDELGEHANYGHRPLMYDTVTRVPLVMQNVGQTGRVPGPNSLLNLGQTILDIADIDERLGEATSLLSDTDGPAVIQNIIRGDEKAVGVMGEEWKVLYHPEGEWGHGLDFAEPQWEAYKTSDDPFEKDNRWGEHPEALEERLRDQLAKRYGIDGGESGIDDETEERLRELGYVE